MKSSVLAAALTFAVLGASLTTATTQAADNPQQTRMAACNKDAGAMKGDERKAFMSKCLSDKKMTQQEKMKACNVQASDKKGDDRKAFMSNCLKG